MIELYKTHRDVEDPYTVVVDGTAYCADETGEIFTRIGKVKRANGHIYCKIGEMSYLNSDEWGEKLQIETRPALHEKALVAQKRCKKKP